MQHWLEIANAVAIFGPILFNVIVGLSVVGHHVLRQRSLTRRCEFCITID